MLGRLPPRVNGLPSDFGWFGINSEVRFWRAKRTRPLSFWLETMLHCPTDRIGGERWSSGRAPGGDQVSFRCT